MTQNKTNLIIRNSRDEVVLDINNCYRETISFTHYLNFNEKVSPEKEEERHTAKLELCFSENEKQLLSNLTIKKKGRNLDNNDEETKFTEGNIFEATDISGFPEVVTFEIDGSNLPGGEYKFHLNLKEVLQLDEGNNEYLTGNSEEILLTIKKEVKKPPKPLIKPPELKPPIKSPEPLNAKIIGFMIALLATLLAGTLLAILPKPPKPEEIVISEEEAKSIVEDFYQNLSDENRAGAERLYYSNSPISLDDLINEFPRDFDHVGVENLTVRSTNIDQNSVDLLGKVIFKWNDGSSHKEMQSFTVRGFDADHKIFRVSQSYIIAARPLKTHTAENLIRNLFQYLSNGQWAEARMLYAPQQISSLEGPFDEWFKWNQTERGSQFQYESVKVNNDNLTIITEKSSISKIFYNVEYTFHYGNDTCQIDSRVISVKMIRETPKIFDASDVQTICYRSNRCCSLDE